MDFRVIPIYKREPNKYDQEETFVIPVKVISVFTERSRGPVVPILIERLDFFTGELKKTRAITFQKSLNIFNDLKMKLPIETNGTVYRDNGKIMFKVIGAYNPGLVESIFDVQRHILNNDENQIKDLYESNYRDIRIWIGNDNSNEFDILDSNI